jgi:hypothetical protein
LSYQQPQYGPPPGYGGYPQPPRGNGLATAGMVCGIIGIFFANFILGPLAIIFGGVGLSRANKGAPKRNQAIAGIVLGIVAIVVYGILLAVLVNNHHFVV